MLYDEINIEVKNHFRSEKKKKSKTQPSVTIDPPAPTLRKKEKKKNRLFVQVPLAYSKSRGYHGWQGFKVFPATSFTAGPVANGSMLHSAPSPVGCFQGAGKTCGKEIGVLRRYKFQFF